MALEQEEYARRRAFIGDPKDYKKAFLTGADLAQRDETGKGLSNEEITKRMLKFGRSMGGATKVSLDSMAQYRPDIVQKVYRQPDGTFVDENGNPLDAGERVWVSKEQTEKEEGGGNQLPPEIASIFGIKGQNA